jgi:hypothetical protein
MSNYFVLDVKSLNFSYRNSIVCKHGITNSSIRSSCPDAAYVKLWSTSRSPNPALLAEYSPDGRDRANSIHLRERR